DSAAGRAGRAKGARRQPAISLGDGTAGRRFRRLRLSRFHLPSAGHHRRRARTGTGDHRMTVSVDVWLRGTDHATTQSIEGIPHDAAEWTDDDVRLVLEGMLRVMAQLKQPGQEPQTIALRGLSWI